MNNQVFSSFHTRLLIPYYVPGMVLGSTSGNKAEIPALVELGFRWETVLQSVLEGSKCTEGTAGQRRGSGIGRCLQF